jgi:quinol monooxygenase YgiN
VPIYQTARFRVKPEALDKCKQAIQEFVDYVRANEPQTQQYLAMQDTHDATRFLHVLIFTDAAARDRHANSDAVKRFTDVLYPNTLALVEFTEYNVVAAKQSD